tara:strand:- start:2259 stop:2903 length:645 start_codon:yes stop_codon:yes gene_type:complete
MPKVAMNYQNNIIYKIQHKSIDELIYIGSTTNFAKRKYHHKSNCYNEKDIAYNEKKYVMIRENGGWNMFDMVLVKKYPCNDYLEARQEEECIRREMNANMNAYRCFRSQEDYNEDHKIGGKKYRETHKEYFKIYGKQYYENHKEERNEYSKQYQESHKEEIIEKQKKKYETHKEDISEKNKEKVECECGCIITYGNLTKHKKTHKHLKLVNNKN